MHNEMIDDRIYFSPATMLYPLPVVMVSCAGLQPNRTQDRPNIITVAWAGTICSEPPMLSISIRKSRHSHRLISSTGEFVVNLVSQKLAHVCDYCGVRTGAKENKFASCGLTPIPAKEMQYAPAIHESPVHLSCKVEKIIELGSHDLFISKILTVSVDPLVVDAKGKICIERCDLITYLHGEYYSLDKMLGFFGYSVASSDKLKSRMKKKCPKSDKENTDFTNKKARGKL